MRKRILTRPVCVMLSDEMYRQIVEITDKEETSVSDYIREAIQEKLLRIKKEGKFERK